MGLETATYIAGLNAANPTPGDSKSQGDDHLRLIKSTAQSTFAGFPGMVLVSGTEAQVGTVNDYQVTISPAPAAYTARTVVEFRATHTNTAAATVQINGLGLLSLRSVDGAPLSAGDIESGALVVVCYDQPSNTMQLVSGNDRANRNGEVYRGTHDFVTNAAVANVQDQPQFTANNAAANTRYVVTYFAPLANPALTGVPTAPTAAPGTNTTQIATTAFAQQLAFSAALPAQIGNSFLTTSAGVAAWTGDMTGKSGFHATTNGTVLVWTQLINEGKAANVASASTIVLDGILGNLVHVTGTTTVNTITLAAGASRTIVADGAFTIANSANIVVPGSANLVLAVNDVVMVRGDTGGVVRVESVTRAAVGATPALLFLAVHEVGVGVNGGLKAAQQEDRPINTVKSNGIPGASLATNKVTLPPGVYTVTATGSTGGSSSTKTVVYNVTDATVIAIGVGGYNTGIGISMSSSVTTRFILTATKEISIRQYMASFGGSTADYGQALSLASTNEVYATLEIRKDA